MRRFLLLMTGVVGASLFAYDFVYPAFVQGKIARLVQATALWMSGGVSILLIATAAIYLAASQRGPEACPT